MKQNKNMEKKEFTGMRYYKDIANSVRDVLLGSDWGWRMKKRKTRVKGG